MPFETSKEHSYFSRRRKEGRGDCEGLRAGEGLVIILIIPWSKGQTQQAPDTVQRPGPLGSRAGSHQRQPERFYSDGDLLDCFQGGRGANLTSNLGAGSIARRTRKPSFASCNV